MGRYYGRKRKNYEVHGDVILPCGEYFTKNDMNDVAKALRRIAIEKGIEKRLFFDKRAGKRKNF